LLVSEWPLSGRIKKWAKKIAEENDLSTTDVKSFVKDVKHKSLEARKDVRNRAKKVIERISQKAKTPTYNISTSENEGIVEIVFTGEVTKDFIEKLGIELYAILKPMNPEKLLADVRSLKMPREYIEAYSRFTDYLPPLRVNIAIVDIPENADFESFLEAIANNAGLSLKCFTDISKARSWLKSK
jgi:polyhydroxyalkanoate synthesis regulator phasin